MEQTINRTELLAVLVVVQQFGSANTKTRSPLTLNILMQGCKAPPIGGETMAGCPPLDRWPTLTYGNNSLMRFGPLARCFSGSRYLAMLGCMGTM